MEDISRISKNKTWDGRRKATKERQGTAGFTKNMRKI
jgi:hypothetical protein